MTPMQRRFTSRATPAKQGSRLARVQPAARAAAAEKRSTPIALICMMWVFMWLILLPEGLKFTGLVPEEMNTPEATIGQTAAQAMQTIPTQGSVLTRITWLGLLFFGLAVIASRSSGVLKLLRRTNPFLLIFIGLAIVSAAWSIAPSVTFRRWIRLITAATDAAAFVLLARSTTNFQAVLRAIYTAFLVGSIIFVLAYPMLGMEQLNQVELIGAWRGLATQKNGLGAVAAMATILWLHATLSKEVPSWRSLLGLGISVFCLAKSRSSTSLMAAFFAGGLLMMLMRPPSALRRYMPYITALYVSLLLIYSLAVLNLIPGSGLLLSPVTGLVGKDLTFSGRTAIWDVLKENIALHPLLGGGYGAYWTGLPNSPSMLMLQRLYFYPTESHNGYIDVYNDLGLIGELCLTGYIITYLRQGIAVYRRSRSQGALYLTLLFIQMIGNLSEARWFNALSGSDLLITMVATLTMAKILSEQTPRKAAGMDRSRLKPEF